MGEVYRARDTRLDRTVAIKILPAALADDPQFKERFDREARAISQLDHPNICALYDTGQQDGTAFLVMQYLEGETLADRVAKGPLPLEQALAIAVQIADALVAAHRAGIVHRDLKPGNVMLTKTGAKLLDFGLAKSGASIVAGSGGSMLPTTPAALTIQGQILGTFQYMAPEQLEGGEADARTDIFAFGALLHEMVTGKKAFEGKSHASLVAAILERQPPPLSSLQPLSPPDLDRIVSKCLAKDPDDRWQSARDLKDALKWIGTGSASATTVGSTIAVAPIARRRPGGMAWTVAALAVAASVVLGVGWWSAARPVEKSLVRVSVDLGPQAVRSGRVTAVLSPDGTRLVYVANAPGGVVQLMTRRLDQVEASVLSDTESANPPQPFFSPDGQWIGFVGSGVIKKVSVNGGGAVSLAVRPDTVFGAAWTDSGEILLGSANGLARVPEAGGAAAPVKTYAGAIVFPDPLPGGKVALVNLTPRGGIGSLDDLDIAAVTLASGVTKTLLHGGHGPRYFPGSGGLGYILYVRRGVLFAVAFDPERLEVRGNPAPLVEDVAADTSQAGGGQFAFSRTGTLVYLQGKPTATRRALQWLDAAGQLKTLVPEEGDYAAPRISPDGRRVAYTVVGSKGTDVWVYESGRDAPTQITFSSPGGRELAWAPDSRHLVYGDVTALWWTRADGSSQPQKILDGAASPRPGFFSADGRLAYSVSPSGLPDAFTLPLDLRDPEHPRPGAPQPFLTEPQVEVDPAFSPDGKFIAYASNEGNAEDVYVRPFPGPGGKWKISTGGGKFPTFARTTHELFFLGSDDRIWVTSYTIQDGAFNAGKPRVWSPVKIFRDGVRQNFDISPDGTHAVVFPSPQAETQAGSLHATFLFNFFDEVRRRVK